MRRRLRKTVPWIAPTAYCPLGQCALDGGDYMQQYCRGQVPGIREQKWGATMRRSSMQRSARDLVFAAVLSGAIAAAGCSKEEQAPQQRPAPQVTVITVKPRTIPSVPSFVAQTESSQQVDIVARVSGYLDKIAYQEGDLVKEGQILFQIDPKPFKAQLDAAKGELQAQQARHATAAANLKRVG